MVMESALNSGIDAGLDTGFDVRSEVPRCEKPSPFNAFLEARVPLEIGSLFLASPALALAPRGRSRPIMLLPGFGASESSMAPLAAFLRYLGYRTYNWGIGRNRGGVDMMVPSVAERVAGIAERYEEPVTMIGWSLGGVVAREVARTRSEVVSEIITMGTPVKGGPKYTSIGASFAASRGINLDRFEIEVHRRNSIGLSQPITVVYSKLDGVVGWQAAIDSYNPQAKNIEVSGTHLGLGVNPRVWQIVADTLARDQSRTT
ncbi:MAG: alpha/beta hydrolase [Pseudomonadota bacterium]